MQNQNSDFWQSPNFPNVTGSSSGPNGDCTASGCIFNLSEDPSEYADLSSSQPKIAATLLTAINAERNQTFSPNRGAQSDLSCLAAGPGGKWNGFWGPFVELE